MVFYDFECFKFDWLVVLIEPDKKETTVIVNDRQKLIEFYTTHKEDIWVGYNSRHYDQFILKGIICGFDPWDINEHIIIKDLSGYSFSTLLNKVFLINYDVMPNPPIGLKTLEGFMGNDIKESDVDFRIERKLTPEEIEETIKYCTHDVGQTIEVFLNLIDDFNTMLYFVKHFQYPLAYIGKTKAQLSAIMLGGNSTGHEYRQFDFPILDCIKLDKYKEVMEFYKNPLNHDYGKTLDIDVCGVPHRFAWGGGHGAIKKYHGKGIYLMIDVTAYYPSQQQQYKFGYRVMDHPENFEFIHGSNIKFKRAGNKKARLPFKIMDNAISGQLKQSISTLYDPASNNAICINGQLLLLDLVEKLEPYCELIQNNTDGILVRLYDYNDFDKIDDIVYEWEQRTGMKMDFDEFRGEVFQKDVNNYLVVDRETGAVKRKGAYVKSLSKLDYDLPIINEALVSYMVDGTPVEKTINGCHDLIKFQKIVVLSGKYDYVKHNGKRYHYKCYRVFASKDRHDGQIYKCRIGGKAAKFGNTPEHCFIDNSNVNDKETPDNLDRQWYIELAKKRLEQFGVSADNQLCLELEV